MIIGIIVGIVLIMLLWGGVAFFIKSFFDEKEKRINKYYDMSGWVETLEKQANDHKLYPYKNEILTTDILTGDLPNGLLQKDHQG